MRVCVLCLSLLLVFCVPALAQEICDDNMDNDGDQFTDCDDFDCMDDPACAVEICDDDMDNDGDQFTDCDDFDCMNDPACAVEICDDDMDNDGDQFTDCDDFDCMGDPACAVEICDDDMDNDGDQFTDCDDFDCLFSGVCESEAMAAAHSADVDFNGVIALSELLRVIQLFNSAGYHCEDVPGEDGFVPGEDAQQQACDPHDSDFDTQDWVISLGELLRLIQLYNVGGYEPCASDDGFCVNAG
jgi:hypothetical protein